MPTKPEPALRHPKIVLKRGFRTKNGIRGEYFWYHVQAANGEPLLTSEMYTSRRRMLDGMGAAEIAYKGPVEMLIEDYRKTVPDPGEKR